MTIIDDIERDANTPPGESGLDQAIRHRDEMWWGQAMRGIQLLADRNEPFDAFDLREVGVPEPDSPNRYGALFRTASRAGVIEYVKHHKSKRPGRSGGSCALWRGKRP